MEGTLLSIPSLDSHGLLPGGIHDCSVSDIERAFGWNPHRLDLLDKFKNCLIGEIRPKFSEPIYFDGSFVTDKEIPDDIDMVLELNNSPDATKWQGLVFLRDQQSRLMKDYRVHFWINLPGNSDFCHFFQYIGIKTANFKGLNPKHLKGILRLS